MKNNSITKLKNTIAFKLGVIALIMMLAISTIFAGF